MVTPSFHIIILIIVKYTITRISGPYGPQILAPAGRFLVWVPSPGNSSHSVLHCILVLSPVDCILAVTRVWHGDPLYVGNGKRWGWFSDLGDIFNKGFSKYTWCVLPLSNKWCPKNVSDREGSELNLFCPLLPWYSKRTNSGWGPFLGASEKL